MPPTVDPLAGVWAKIDRAKQHLSDIDRVKARFLETNKDAFVREDKPDRRQRVYYVRKDPVTTDLAIFVGDVVHNLRCALDHLAYALCRAGPGRSAAAQDQESLKSINFPISGGNANDYRALNSRDLW